jgi:hypothetical protein
MRLSATGVENDALTIFSNWLIEVDNGNIGTQETASSLDNKIIRIPLPYLITTTTEPLVSLIDFIYPAETLQQPSPVKLSTIAIVCPKNETAGIINEIIMRRAPGETSSYLSMDSITPHNKDTRDMEALYPQEYLSGLNFSGIPPHQLSLKKTLP